MPSYILQPSCILNPSHILHPALRCPVPWNRLSPSLMIFPMSKDNKDNFFFQDSTQLVPSETSEEPEAEVKIEG